MTTCICLANPRYPKDVGANNHKFAKGAQSGFRTLDAKVAVPVALYCAAFALYCTTASPAMGWLDSPEFVAQGITLGIAHSPGHPLLGILGRLATLVPIGDVVWRINLLSAACASAAVVFVYLAGSSILRQTCNEAPRRVSIGIACSLAAVLGVGFPLWSNAVRAEVYALQAALSGLIFLGLVRYERDGRGHHLLLVCLASGLALANHHVMALSIIVPGVVFVFARRAKPTWRLCATCFAMGLLGLLALAYLPVRSLSHPAVNWGAPHTLERFFWTLSGKAFTKSVHLEHASSPLVDLFQCLGAVASGVTVPVFFAAILGIYLGLRTSRTRRTTLFLLAVVMTSIAMRVLLGFDPLTPDDHAYLLPAVFAVVFLALQCAGLLIAVTASLQRARMAPTVLAALAIALVPVQTCEVAPTANQRNAWASDDMAHWELDHLPPRSLLLLGYFQTSFRVWAMQTVGGARPDVATLDRGFLTYPGMADEAKHRWPDLAELIDAPLSTTTPTPLKVLNAVPRPVLVQLNRDMDAPLRSQLVPAGPFAYLMLEGTDESGALAQRTDRMERQALTNIAQRAATSEQHFVTSALLWHDLTRLEHLCTIGNRVWAQEVYEDARSIASDDELLQTTATQCGLTK